MTKQTIIEKVLRPIEKAGFCAFFVGGCVRDEVQGKEPHDFDVATSATPEQLKQIFTQISNLSENSEPFGVTMPIIDGEVVEISTFRKDMTKGRHPTIVFTTDVGLDAQRRDFTMNALYEDADGQILDPTGKGLNDAECKILRFVGSADERLSEDPLRAFRAVRFLSTGKAESAVDIFPTKWESDYRECSKERVLKEVKQIFAGQHFLDTHVQEAMRRYGLNDHLGICELYAQMSCVAQSPKWHLEGATVQLRRNGQILRIIDESDIPNEPYIVNSNGSVLAHTQRVMRKMMELLDSEGYSDTEDRFILMLTALLHDVGKFPAAKKNGYKKNDPTVYDVHDHDILGAPIARDWAKEHLG